MDTLSWTYNRGHFGDYFIIRAFSRITICMITVFLYVTDLQHSWHIQLNPKFYRWWRLAQNDMPIEKHRTVCSEWFPPMKITSKEPFVGNFLTQRIINWYPTPCAKFRNNWKMEIDSTNSVHSSRFRLQVVSGGLPLVQRSPKDLNMCVCSETNRTMACWVLIQYKDVILPV